MRRILNAAALLLVAFVLGIGLAACGSDNSNDQPGSATTQSTDTSETTTNESTGTDTTESSGNDTTDTSEG